MRSKVAIFLILAVLLALSPNTQAHLAGEPTRIPPTLSATGEGEILTGIWPRALAVEGSSNNLWVANGFDNTVMRIDEGTGKPLEAPIPAGSQPTAMVWTEFGAIKTMWVASYDDIAITPIEFDQGKPVKRAAIPLPDRPVGMVLSGGNLWIITQVKDSLIAKDNLLKFDPASKTVVATLTVGTFPTAIINSATDTLPDDHILYVANGHDDSISVIDTRANGGKGAVIATVTEGVPPFPFSLSFDGAYLWIGSYECTKYDKDNCSDSKVARINTKSGKAEPVTEELPGRQVYVSFNAGHIFVANGHGKGMADVNSVTVSAQRKTFTSPSNKGRESYFGAVVMTKRYIYVADWTNDRLLRFAAPGPIAIPPTPTFSPPTATALPSPTPEPCWADDNFKPQLTAGQKGRVVDDKFVKPLNIRKEPNFTKASLTGKQFQLGDEFVVIAGPFGNNKPIDKTNEKSCFYQVEGLKDKSFAGFVTQGGLASDGKDIRYYIEALK